MIATPLPAEEPPCPPVPDASAELDHARFGTVFHQNIVAAVQAETVCIDSGATEQAIVPTAAVKHVVAAEAENRIGVSRADQYLFAGCTGDRCNGQGVERGRVERHAIGELHALDAIRRQRVKRRNNHRAAVGHRGEQVAARLAG